MKNIIVPIELLLALEEKGMCGNYKLDHVINWVSPMTWDEIDHCKFCQEFDGKTTVNDSDGVLCGALRICNTGCEGYHIYVFSGGHTGEIWDDQRVPFNYIIKLDVMLNEYIENIRKYGINHIKIYGGVHKQSEENKSRFNISSLFSKRM